MKLFKCFKPCRGQSSNQRTSESHERNIMTASHTSTVSSSYQGSQTSRMPDSLTLITPEDLHHVTPISSQPMTPMPSRITSPRRVIIVNPDNTRFLGVPSQTKTTFITTPSMQQVWERLLTLSKLEIQKRSW
ncbi:AC4 [Sida golden mosaic Lara virus]|uniref:AC4 n=1 Tax=Sida golden mosaic Lara virus TaxID=1002681 RepID=L0APS5_9GEMI|nr:AC4 [Sida golden mosaic Lara virus]AFZ77102.1 AC4 [Sida golden mosaic Lara virus]